MKKIAVIALVIVMAMFFAANANDPAYAAALGWVIIGGPIAAIAALIVRRRQRSTNRRTARDGTVEICIARPLVPVPTFRGMYQSLPAHCWRALDIGE
jgi:pheromone shutdown protein TraB